MLLIPAIIFILFKTGGQSYIENARIKLETKLEKEQKTFIKQYILSLFSLR